MSTGIGNKIIQYRWPLGIILWLILIVLQIHGSSIGFYAHLLNAPELDTAIFGINHNFQLDEWAVFTPLTFSQYFSGFSYFSDIPRAALTDIAVVYGQPCWDIITLFRPFLWGYLFLPVGNGLAFFWMGRLIFLFLVSYEFGVFFLQGDKKLSLGYALMVAFSPIVQWWFSINGFVEILIWGQCGVLLVKHYVQTASYRKRFVCILGLAYCIVAYAIVIYPAWQVAFAYIFLVIAGWVIYTGYEKTKWTYKDLLLGGALLCLVLFPLIHFIVKSWDTIQAFMNSSYPGQRRNAGGGLPIKWLWRYPMNYVASFGFNMKYMPTVFATFLSFSPLGLLLVVWQYYKHHIKDNFIGSLIVLLVVYVMYFLIPWPSFLANATLLSYVPTGRLIPAIDFIQLLILFRALSFHAEVFNRKMVLASVIAYVLIIVWAVNDMILPELFFVWLSVILLFSVFAAVYILRLRRALILVLVLIAFAVGMIANPIARGVQSVNGTDLAKKITEIASEDQGKWLVDNDYSWNEQYIDYMNSYPIMFGAPTLNSVNLYTCWPRWNQLNLSDKQKNIINRYAHMNISLSNGEKTEFQNPKENETIQDIVNIKLNVNDLKKLQVAYVLSDRDLQFLSTDFVVLEPIYTSNGFTIYQIYYK